MEIKAWCGRCGQRFDLAELTAAPQSARCPRCGEPFALDYTVPLVVAAQSLALAVETLLAAGTSLRGLAPRLHIDSAALADQLRSALDY